MRGYDCHYYRKYKGKLYKNSNQACWAGLFRTKYLITNQEKVLLPQTVPDEIYIDKYKGNSTKHKDVKNLLSIINIITPCRISQVKGKKYIKYTLIRGTRADYNVNLIIVNFIRMMWNNQGGNINLAKFYNDITAFEETNDPLKFLLTCLRNNIAKTVKYPLGHSNVMGKIIPKTTEHMLTAYKKEVLETSTYLRMKL